MDVEACLCGGQVRRGDDRKMECPERGAVRVQETSADRPSLMPAVDRVQNALNGVSGGSFDGDGTAFRSPAALPDAPQPQSAVKKFGFKSITAQGGYITGLDGSGVRNGSIALEFYRQKTKKAGTFSGEVELGGYTMSGIPINNSQDVGVVDQLPDGTPIEGTAVTTGRSPAATYIPIADFKYLPPLKLGLVHPYAVAEGGVTRLWSTNAKVDTQVVASVGGQVVGVQDMGPSLQPTGEGFNHAGGLFGGGAKIDLTKSGRVAVDAQYGEAPSGYKIFKSGLTLQLGKRQSSKRDDRP